MSASPPDSGDDPEVQGVAGGLMGTGRTGPMWIPARDLNNSGAVALHRGKYRKAIDLLERAIALTTVPLVEAVVADPDSADANTADLAGDALDVRARALGNLAGVLEHRGDIAGALRTYAESESAALLALRLIGDRKGSRAVWMNSRIARGQALLAGGRAAEALAAADEMAPQVAALPAEADPKGSLAFSVANLRCGALLELGRYQEALQASQEAVEAGRNSDPEVLAYAYNNLAAIRHAMEDVGSAVEYQQLAAQLSGLGEDAKSRQLAAENAAVMAVSIRDLAGAEERFEEAARLAAELELPERVAACRLGQARVLAARKRIGGIGRARAQIRAALAEFEAVRTAGGDAPGGAPGESPGGVPGEDLGGAVDAGPGGAPGPNRVLREGYALLGDMESLRGRYDAADAAYQGAMANSGNAYDRCRVDLRRAEMRAEWASVSPLPAMRRQHLQEGLSLAVPVMLTTDALREGFAPGPDREWWATTVCAPARELAFRLASLSGELGLLYELVENYAALSTLRRVGDEVRAPASPTSNGSAGADGAVPGRLFDASRLFPGAAGSDPSPEGETIAEPAPVVGPGPEGELAPAAGTLPAAGAGVVPAGAAAASGTAQDPADRMVRPAPAFALPPLLRLAPGAPVSLEPWVQAARERYGVEVRSREVIPAW